MVNPNVYLLSTVAFDETLNELKTAARRMTGPAARQATMFCSHLEQAKNAFLVSGDRSAFKQTCLQEMAGINVTIEGYFDFKLKLKNFAAHFFTIGIPALILYLNHRRHRQSPAESFDCRFFKSTMISRVHKFQNNIDAIKVVETTTLTALDSAQSAC